MSANANLDDTNKFAIESQDKWTDSYSVSHSKAAYSLEPLMIKY